MNVHVSDTEYNDYCHKINETLSNGYIKVVSSSRIKAPIFKAVNLLFHFGPKYYNSPFPCVYCFFLQLL